MFVTLCCSWAERPGTRLCGRLTERHQQHQYHSHTLQIGADTRFQLIFSIILKPDVKRASDAARFFFSVSCQTFRCPGVAIWLFVEMWSNSTLGALLNWFHLSATLGLASDLPAAPPKICPPPSPATHTLPSLPSGAENVGGFQPVCGI